MKNSRKFIWIVIGAIAAFVIILTVIVRVMVSDYLVVSAEGEGISFDSSRPTASREFSMEDFSRLRIEGGWDVKVISDDFFGVTVEYGQDAKNAFRVEQDGDTLNLLIDWGRKGSVSDLHGASATIHMPAVSEINVEGAVNLKLENFSSDELSFKLEGAGQAIGDNCSFEQLNIKSSGAVNVDFSKSRIANADINVDGAGNVVLHMTGGELTGNLAGFSNLEYSGDVSRIAVEKDGIGSINHKN